MRKIVCMCLLGACLAGCKPTERVVEVVRTDTLIVQKVQRDSVYIEKERHDSVYIHQKGDTVLVEKWHTEWRDLWRDRVVHDSVYIAKHDTISQTITKTEVKEKEKKLSWWEKVRISLGNVFLLVLVILAVVFAVKYLIMKFVRP